MCEAVLRRSDLSGLLVSASRAISGASDIGLAARALRDEINACRTRMKSTSCTGRDKAADYPAFTVGLQSAESMEKIEAYQRAFIDFALAQGALQFGSFVLKSGRVSPYFFNAGRFCSGEAMTTLANAYAQSIRASGVGFDMFFGPAYKGIPLATTISVAWYQLYGEVLSPRSRHLPSSFNPNRNLNRI